MPDDEKPDGKSGGEYEVGYGKPPKHTQFKPGQSGNPKGRPKGTKNLKTDLIEELGEKVTIREDGKSRPVSKQRALVKSICMKGLQGDIRASRMVIELMLRLLDTGEGDHDDTGVLNEDELDILREHEERVRRRARSETAGVDDQNDDEPEGAS